MKVVNSISYKRNIRKLEDEIAILMPYIHVQTSDSGGLTR